VLFRSEQQRTDVNQKLASLTGTIHTTAKGGEPNGGTWSTTNGMTAEEQRHKYLEREVGNWQDAIDKWIADNFPPVGNNGGGAGPQDAIPSAVGGGNSLPQSEDIPPGLQAEQWQKISKNNRILSWAQGLQQDIEKGIDTSPLADVRKSLIADLNLVIDKALKPFSLEARASIRQGKSWADGYRFPGIGTGYDPEKIDELASRISPSQLTAMYNEVEAIRQEFQALKRLETAKEWDPTWFSSAWDLADGATQGDGEKVAVAGVGLLAPVIVGRLARRLRAGGKLIRSLADIPTNATGFDKWFDSLTAKEVARLYENPSYAKKIETQLRGSGSMHEFLMVAEAPKWKAWGITAQQVKEDFAISIEELNNSLAKGWKHSTGLKGTSAPNSTTVHNELQAIIKKSNSLAEFKQNMREWAEKWLEGGYDSLPKGFHE